ncbi:DUF3540 domain-containing protein [Hyalangium rubrum]|uniref:DUF3540 domain-containing protein n=1 Tax=Hyalangium rubrum TaxID=3103134 RepID=A0ABU5H144_9BACT|nr:DUF3540 domain-containing protein [Hyalangium sp. s54d21]MDY7227178.1 DUF3540 domain-containing protein [Hyalangium sp. s54d21]
MEKLAGRIGSTVIQQDVGSVLSTEGASLSVAVGGTPHPAKRAPSCLLAPEPGDLVLVTFVPGRGCYVLAVLEREEGAPGRLVHQGNLGLHLPAGRLTVTASEGMSVVSGQDVSCVTSSLRAHAVEANLSIEKAHFLGTFASVQVETLKVIGRFFDSVLERFSQRVRRSYRQVEEVDSVRAEQLDYMASKNVSVRGRNALVTAEQLVKLDGDQVHLG